MMIPITSYAGPNADIIDPQLMRMRGIQRAGIEFKLVRTFGTDLSR